MIWLIGNKGMLGSDVEKLFAENKLDFIVSDKEVDICDIEKLRNIISKHKISWIVNCSGYTNVDKAEDEVEKAFEINAQGVFNITKITNEVGAKLIHISTDYVFDGNKSSEYFESDIANPLGVYGRSKLEGERNILSNSEKYFIIRTAWLYGNKGNNFVYTMLRLFNERDVIKVVDDQYGSPTFTKDLAKLVLNVISSNSDKYGIYNFTNEGMTTWYKFACKIYELAKEYKMIKKDVSIVPIKTEDYSTKAKRPKYTYLSKEKVKRTFKFSIRDWDSALNGFLNPSHLQGESGWDRARYK